eukprot:240780_1
METVASLGLNAVRWASNTVKDVRIKAEGYVGSDLEKKVKEATSNENWGCSGTMKYEIARATYDYEGYAEVMTIVWKRLQESPRNWRCVFKSISLVEYLLRAGSDRVADEIRREQYKIGRLNSFSFIDEGGVDRGSGVRELSKQIVALLNDSRKLKDAREETRRNQSKFMSAGSATGGGGFDYSVGGGDYGRGGGGSSYDNYGGGGSGRRSYEMESRDKSRNERRKPRKLNIRKKHHKEESEEESTPESSDDCGSDFAAEKRKPKGRSGKAKGRKATVPKEKRRPKNKKGGKSKVGGPVPKLNAPPGADGGSFQMNRKLEASKEDDLLDIFSASSADPPSFDAFGSGPAADEFAMLASGSGAAVVVPGPPAEEDDWVTATVVSADKPAVDDWVTATVVPADEPAVDDWSSSFISAPSNAANDFDILGGLSLNETVKPSDTVNSDFGEFVDVQPQQNSRTQDSFVLDDMLLSSTPETSKNTNDPSKAQNNSTDAWNVSNSLVNLDNLVANKYNPNKKSHPLHRGHSMSGMPAHDMTSQNAPLPNLGGRSQNSGFGYGYPPNQGGGYGY